VAGAGATALAGAGEAGAAAAAAGGAGGGGGGWNAERSGDVPSGANCAGAVELSPDMICSSASGTVIPPGLAGTTRNGPGGAVITGGGPNPIPGFIPLQTSATTITSVAMPPAPKAIRRIAGSKAAVWRRVR
jgi:hypothetical protein